jgi:transcriptional regulator with PAS, ATPase and Fis domain
LSGPSYNSTLFFDNIDRLPLDIQAKLLRILQDKKITCFHSNKEKNIDVRIISSASENLTELVANNKFRKDLFYRINIFTIKVPPLRDRKGDIPLLINHFIKKYSSIIGKRIIGITDKALKKCMDYNWPGNVRELENVVQRAIVLANDEFINVNNILLDETSSDMPDYYTLSYKDALRNAVKEVDSFYIKQALVKCNYNKKKAAALLGISIRTLHYKLQHLDI